MCANPRESDAKLKVVLIDFIKCFRKLCFALGKDKISPIQYKTFKFHTCRIGMIGGYKTLYQSDPYLSLLTLNSNITQKAVVSIN